MRFAPSAQTSAVGATWRRNLLVLWFAELVAIVAFAIPLPFLPLYLKELGVTNESELAALAGLTAGATGVALAVMAPVWGLLSDRYGRKPMLVRAMLLGAVALGLMAFARNSVDVVVLRFLEGATTGTVAAATALVAVSTPRERLPAALGTLSSAIAIGSAIGPLVGSTTVSLFGLRATFLIIGVLLLVAGLAVLGFVAEPHLVADDGVAPGQPVTLRTIALLLGLAMFCQFVLYASYEGFLTLVSVRLVQGLSTSPDRDIGLVFAACGLATGVSAAAFARVAGRYRAWVIGLGGALLLAVSEIAGAASTSTTSTLVAMGLVGAAYGLVSPAIASVLAASAPSEVQGRAFGMTFSAGAVGMAVGPLGTGLIAASPAGISTAMVGSASMALVLAGALAVLGRHRSYAAR